LLMVFCPLRYMFRISRNALYTRSSVWNRICGACVRPGRNTLSTPLVRQQSHAIARPQTCRGQQNGFTIGRGSSSSATAHLDFVHIGDGLVKLYRRLRAARRHAHRLQHRREATSHASIAAGRSGSTADSFDQGYAPPAVAAQHPSYRWLPRAYARGNIIHADLIPLYVHNDNNVPVRSLRKALHRYCRA
jgi:hypothetical protein